MATQDRDDQGQRALDRVDASPLDRPLNPTYLGVLATEFVIVVLLVLLGKFFS